MRKVFYKILRESVIKSSFGSCGKNVHIAEKSDIKGMPTHMMCSSWGVALIMQSAWKAV